MSTDSATATATTPRRTLTATWGRHSCRQARLLAGLGSRAVRHHIKSVCGSPLPHLLAICVASLVITGCGDLVSLHALFTPKDQVLDPAIEVRWEDDSD